MSLSVDSIQHLLELLYRQLDSQAERLERRHNDKEGESNADDQTNAGDYDVDHVLIEKLLAIAMTLIASQLPQGNLDVDSPAFLQLIQLFVDLLKADSMLTSSERSHL